MNRNAGALLRDIRNMKKHNTITFSMTSKDIPGSNKDIKKARSSEQINLKGLVEVWQFIFRTKTKKLKILT